ncbi:multidrug resistance pump [Dorcoceras hygrometricum]|uniref:Protein DETOXIFICATION n=1 Tax=Dorcoceras hygrometricum TaxID=472368 RepID=A0A2Z7C5S1_9LAMI|nr:multidrug resistance pump [Dorcoceras hygrometricum]
MGSNTGETPSAGNGIIQDESFKHRIWNESKKIWVVAGPAILTRCSTSGANAITQAFIGHIGTTELAAFALIVTVLMRFATGLLLGMSSGLETLCGQAYGARQYHMLGIFLQRSWLILALSSILLLPFFVFATPIFKVLGQEESISDMAGTLSLWFIPVMYSYITSFSCQMFLQAQSKNKIISYLAAFSLCIHVLLSWLLTVEYRFGIAGVAISNILAYWIPNIGQLAFIFSGRCKETWKGFSMLAFKDLWPVIKLSVSAGAMLCLEVWYNSVLILLTGRFKNSEVEIDALSICLNISGWEIMVAFGFLAAASVRISNELGSGDPKAAKFSIAVIVITSFSIGILLFIVCIFLREQLGYIFTKSPEVAAEVAHLSPLLAFSMLMNSVQPVLSGVAIGAGWQSSVVFVNIGSYYLIGIPFGAILGYVFNLHVMGVWIGMLIGTLIQTIILITLTCKTDWDKQVSIAKTRVNKWLAEATE